ncbi:sensor histidine kinase [Rubritalea spongiae]|uniref:Oxygen sensor histidine kinase NreB n=1 Tax=Rubritalea spongiae TaxID=430797 RepID=A0ABW5E9N6_9BACT
MDLSEEDAVCAPESVSLFAIPETLRRLEQQREQMQAELELLPELDPVLQNDAFGYHGGYLPALETLPEEPRWTVDVRFYKKAPIKKVVLVPAVDRRFSKVQSYGFPRRFRVSQIADDGSVRVVKEWMSEDCPDPGRSPIVIDLQAPWPDAVRLEVFRGAMEEGKEYLALDELFGIAKNEVFKAETVEVSREYTSLPYWHRSFLVDQQTNLGIPVAADVLEREGSRAKDYSVEFEEAPTKPCVIHIDLGRNRRLGWVSLYPAKPPEGILIPGYGFPKKVELKVFQDTKEHLRRVQAPLAQSSYEVDPSNNVHRMAGYNRLGRWIEITVSDFPEHNGRRVFSLGEILVGNAGETYRVKEVWLEGFPQGAEQGSEQLIDLMSNGKPAMFLQEWLLKLRDREELSRRLQRHTAWIEELNGRWDQFFERMRVGVVVALVLIALSIAVIAIVQRVRAVRKMRYQISRDLHDDVGGTLGSIALVAEEIGSSGKGDKTLQGDVEELVLLSREAFVSLREVIWLTDKSTIRLPELLERLEERCQRMLRGVDLSVEREGEFPDLVVSLTYKRHLLLFFREVISNCARHSGAKKVSLVFKTDEGLLTISLEDDGCGFDPERSFKGWGLKSLKKRADEMQGEMLLKSSPGGGTLIVLSVPLRLLTSKLVSSYQTSN